MRFNRPSFDKPVTMKIMSVKWCRESSGIVFVGKRLSVKLFFRFGLFSVVKKGAEDDWSGEVLDSVTIGSISYLQAVCFVFNGRFPRGFYEDNDR
jgi:hypothetical protein